MLISNLDWSDYVGRIAIGRITSGTVKTGDVIWCIHKNGKREKATAGKVFEFSGMRTSESVTGEAGNIVGIAGFEELEIGETLCATPRTSRCLSRTSIRPPSRCSFA